MDGTADGAVVGDGRGPGFDAVRAEAFGGRLVGMMNDAAVLLMTSLGHRTRLFDVMAGRPRGTTGEIAGAAGLSERYVREWLGAMVAGGFVEFDPEAGTYRLPAEHAAWLTREAVSNVAASAQWIALLGSVETEVAEAFTHGKGVPYSAYRRFHEVMAEESAQTVVAALDDHILPLVPGLVGRLEAGIDVLDIGCGGGRALVHLAARFPDSRFAGYDLSAEAVAAAEAEATRRGVRNARFEVRDLAELEGESRFDLVTAFDVIHDQARPGRVLENVRRLLKPGGVFLMQDISCAGHHARDREHPFGPFLYTVSCMHCMSVSLANGGPGLGAAWGKATALRMLGEAGFGDVRVEALPHDPLNFYFVMTR